MTASNKPSNLTVEENLPFMSKEERRAASVLVFPRKATLFSIGSKAVTLSFTFWIRQNDDLVDSPILYRK